MSRRFVRSLSQYLELSSAPVTAVPLTMAAWAKINDITNSHVLFALSSTSADGATNFDNFSIQAGGAVAGDPLRATCNQGATSGSIGTSVAYPQNRWFHAAGVFRSATDRSVYLDGGNRANSTVSVTPSVINRLGMRYAWNPFPAGYPDGSIQWPALWNVALSDSEILQLALGTDPRTIRPDNLIVFLDLDEPISNAISHNRLYQFTDNGPCRFDSDNPPFMNKQKQRRYWQFVEGPGVGGNRRRRVILCGACP